MLSVLTGAHLHAVLEIVEARLVRTLEVRFGDKAKDDGGRRKAVLVPAGRVRSISQIPEGGAAVDPQ
jgi:ATP-dependent RNA helicase SUPV3L1/SUV3